MLDRLPVLQPRGMHGHEQLEHAHLRQDRVRALQHVLREILGFLESSAQVCGLGVLQMELEGEPRFGFPACVADQLGTGREISKGSLVRHRGLGLASRAQIEPRKLLPVRIGPGNSHIEVVDDLEQPVVDPRAAGLLEDETADALVQRGPLGLGNRRIRGLLQAVVRKPVGDRRFVDP